MADVTRLLKAADEGDPRAPEELLPLVYEELRKLAMARLAREQAGQSLQPTALVHEAYLRLVSEDGTRWQGSGHFFAAAAEAMRRILVESARRKATIKRGGDRGRADVDVDQLAVPQIREDVIALDEALDRLAAVDAEAARLVQLRYFAGLTLTEAAEALGVSPRTADRLWSYARAWLHEALRDDGS